MVLKSLSKKINKNSSNNKYGIIHNKYVLYFVFIVSLFDLFYLAVARDFFSISIFILIGFITSFFSKNMMIILFIALTFSNILKTGNNLSEGLENKKFCEETFDWVMQESGVLRTKNIRH